MQTSIKEALALPISIVITALTAMPSMAGVLTYATKVEFYNNKGTQMEEYRKTLDNAIGAPQIDSSNNSNKNFLSLGIGGEAIFSFGTLFSKQVTLWETTWGNYSTQAGYDEQVQVFVGNSLDGNDWLNIGTIRNIADNAYKNSLGATLNINNDNTYKYVKLVDKSQSCSCRVGIAHHSSDNAKHSDRWAMPTLLARQRSLLHHPRRLHCRRRNQPDSPRISRR
jgi:hypothetical protein